MKSLTRPVHTEIASRLIARAFSLYDRDFLNGKEPNIAIDQRAQLVIDQYEKHKHVLYDCDRDFVI